MGQTRRTNLSPLISGSRFYADGTALITNLTARILRDDGAIVYLNGYEVFRSNVPTDDVDYRTLANLDVDGIEETTFYSYSVDKGLLFEGDNLLAVEIHQSDVASPDLSFALELVADYGPPLPPPPPSLTRGPYLQTGTPTNIIVRWRTDVVSGSIVHYGLAANALTSTISDESLTKEHIVTVPHLLPERNTTTPWERRGQIWRVALVILLSLLHLLRNQRVSGRLAIVARPAPLTLLRRLWVSATLTKPLLARAPRDVWLDARDNAYYSGTDSEYQRAVFEVYTNELRQTVLWSTIGNHESNGDPAPSPNLPYFLNFSFPQNGEAGGLASGTENYYSFDYGNIHFVCLDAMTATGRLPGSGMLTCWRMTWPPTPTCG